MSEFRDALSKPVQLKRTTDGSLEAKPPAAGRFVVFFGILSYFNAIKSHFARFERTKFLTFESHRKN